MGVQKKYQGNNRIAGLFHQPFTEYDPLENLPLHIPEVSELNVFDAFCPAEFEQAAFGKYQIGCFTRATIALAVPNINNVITLFAVSVKMVGLAAPALLALPDRQGAEVKWRPRS